MTMTPSRQFLITQSVLNAALPHAERNEGLRSYHRYGVKHYLDCMFAGGVRPQQLLRSGP